MSSALILLQFSWQIKKRDKTFIATVNGNKNRPWWGIWYFIQNSPVHFSSILVLLKLSCSSSWNGSIRTVSCLDGDKMYFLFNKQGVNIILIGWLSLRCLVILAIFQITKILTGVSNQLWTHQSFTSNYFTSLNRDGKFLDDAPIEMLFMRACLEFLSPPLCCWETVDNVRTFLFLQNLSTEETVPRFIPLRPS